MRDKQLNLDDGASALTLVQMLFNTLGHVLGKLVARLLFRELHDRCVCDTYAGSQLGHFTIQTMHVKLREWNDQIGNACGLGRGRRPTTCGSGTTIPGATT